MKPYSSIVLILTILIAFLGVAGVASAQGTSFTYQGKLNDGSNPATGLYNVQFKLFNAASGPAQIGSTITSNNLPVINGLFTVSLDFGVNFTGSRRWLELAVASASIIPPQPLTVLTPRQEILPTPYAITASNLTGTLPATQLTGTLSSAQLAGNYSTAVTFGNPGNFFAGNGGGLTNLNASYLIWGGCPPWSTCGNAGTVDGVNFLGTIDNRSLDFRVFNTRALRIQQNGVGTPSLVGGFSGNSVPTGIAGATIGGGGATSFPNRVTDTYGVVAGGLGNSVLKNDSFLGGGIGNSISADRAVIGGGRDNTIQTNASNAFLGGGWNNVIQADSHETTIGGGGFNTVRGISSVIAGGIRNTIGIDFGPNPYSVISGGISNRITESLGTGASTISGGWNNLIDFEADWSAIGGGRDNTINRSFAATISGGSGNTMLDQSESATIGGGSDNQMKRDGVSSTISGGSQNLIGYGARKSTIGGGAANTVGTPTPSGFLLGGTIGGGSSNNIADASDYSTIAGGYLNAISNGATFATISGGMLNMVYGTNSTIGGGYSNRINGINSTIGGGIHNQINDLFLPEGSALNTIGGGGSNSIQSVAGGAEAFANTIGGGTENAMGWRTFYNSIGGGFQNGIVSDSKHSTIGGGYQNNLDGDDGTIAGGRGNRIDAYAYYSGSIGGGNYNVIENSDIAAIGGGYTNSIGANANYSTIAGGASNRINSGAIYATIPGGTQAKATHYGQLAYSSGQFTTAGDAQTSVLVCRGTTTTATQTDLFLDGASARLVVPANSTWTYDILVTARTSGGSSAGYQIRGVIENNAGTTALVGAPNVTVLGEDVAAWDATTTADNVNDALVVRVTGAASTTVRWVAAVRTVEVTN